MCPPQRLQLLSALLYPLRSLVWHGEERRVGCRRLPVVRPPHSDMSPVCREHPGTIFCLWIMVLFCICHDKMSNCFVLRVFSLQFGLEMSYWTAVNTVFVLGSLAMYFAVTFTMYSDGLFLALPSAFSFIGEWYKL